MLGYQSESAYHQRHLAAGGGITYAQPVIAVPLLTLLPSLCGKIPVRDQGIGTTVDETKPFGVMRHRMGPP
jgi:hypothetical protein